MKMLKAYFCVCASLVSLSYSSSDFGEKVPRDYEWPVVRFDEGKKN